MKRVVEKDMLAKGLKRTDAQDRSLWTLGCKNLLDNACGENKPGFRRMKRFVSTPGTNGWWWILCNSCVQRSTNLFLQLSNFDISAKKTFKPSVLHRNSSVIVQEALFHSDAMAHCWVALSQQYNGSCDSQAGSCLPCSVTCFSWKMLGSFNECLLDLGFFRWCT